MRHLSEARVASRNEARGEGARVGIFLSQLFLSDARAFLHLVHAAVVLAVAHKSARRPATLTSHTSQQREPHTVPLEHSAK